MISLHRKMDHFQRKYVPSPRLGLEQLTPRFLEGIFGLSSVDSGRRCSDVNLDPDGRPHKFRATFATRCLWAGVDQRTVQQWLGHSDMESTMRYLKPSRSQHVRDKDPE